MTMTYNRIAYEALEIGNPLAMQSVVDAIAQTDLKPGDPALDIGCGNASISIRLAERFGLNVQAVERDPQMAELAAARIAQADVGDRVTLRVTGSAEVLAATLPVRLIVVCGATDAAAPGLRDPVAVFTKLAGHLQSGGYLLWGEPFWSGEPSPEFRQLISITNDYQTHEGWQAAAREAGLEVVTATISDPATKEQFTTGAHAAVHAWVAAHPDAPEGPALLAQADRIRMLIEMEAARVLEFALYLFRKP